ncbi:2-oxoacid:acceptor oxidoreductase family protein [Caldicellulosiruptoraceae bacterium PP1]
MNILIAGVGGQGNILLSKIIAQIYLNKGYNVKTGENIGMSQRGGSVVSFVRVNEVGGPIIPSKNADILIGLELYESLRNLKYLKESGYAFINERLITSNLNGRVDKVEVINTIKENTKNVIFYNLFDILNQVGLLKAENIALLSYISKEGFLDIKLEEIINTLKENLKESVFGMNKILVEKIFNAI